MANREGARAGVALRQVDFLVLAVLHDEPLHGYGIVQAIDRVTDGRVQLRPGDVYRVLYRLHRDGLLTQVGRRSAPAGNERRTYYRITKLGRQAAADEARLLSTISARLLARGT